METAWWLTPTSSISASRTPTSCCERASGSGTRSPKPLTRESRRITPSAAPETSAKSRSASQRSSGIGIACACTSTTGSRWDGWPIRLPLHPQGRPGTEAFQMTADDVLDVSQALGAVGSRFEHEQLALTGQRALAVMNGDHSGLVRKLFRGDLMAEVADKLSDVAALVCGGKLRAGLKESPRRK